MSPYIASLFSPITLGATFRLAAPLLFGIAGFSFSNKAGILNLALESYITFAAFFALLGSWLFNSCWMGLLFGILAGIVFSFLYGCFVFIFRANGLITGVGFNLSSWGLTTMLTVAIFHSRSATNVNAESFSAIDLGLFGDTSWLAQIFNNQTILVYVAPIAIVIAHVVMYKSPFGLRVRTVGQNPDAAQTAGVSVSRVQWISMLTSGVMCGVAGVFISLNSLAMYTENMVAGRGFFVLASTMVAGGNPLGAMIIGYLFAYTQSLSLTWSGLGMPGQLIEMLPYVMVILVMVFTKWKNIKHAGDI